MITALNVGNTILKRAFSENIDITPMKLQKLVYIVYKEYMKRTGDSLFSERFEVWKYGPVVSSMYDVFKQNKANAIKKFGTESDGTVWVVNENSSPNFKIVMDEVWDKYKNIDGIRLSEMTHMKDTAWRKALRVGSPFLSDNDIKEEVSFIE